MRRIRAVVILPFLWCCVYTYTYLRFFAQSVLGFLGFIFWGTAVDQMFGGVAVIVMFKNYRYLFQESYLSLPDWLVLATALTFAISYLDPGNSAVDVIQRKVQCCGVHNYTDWLKASSLYHPACVPESCCKEKYSHCRGDLGHVEQLSEEGCLKKLEDQLYFSMLCIFWCCTVLSILEVLAAVSNGILMRCQPFHKLHVLDSYIFSQDYRY
uniref:Tetraspanin-3-like n=1 Tax=Serinus canaria TaxID=9135 RepID=A0A8C9NB69_SERCA